MFPALFWRLFCRISLDQSGERSRTGILVGERGRNRRLKRFLIEIVILEDIFVICEMVRRAGRFSTAGFRGGWLRASGTPACDCTAVFVDVCRWAPLR
ncbi:MAG: hypothetical protein HKN14_08215 [Marinicaulis sp.]|nr:hypothetical protein [Marinicaulis sp.]